MLRSTAGWAGWGLRISWRSPLFYCWCRAERDTPPLVGDCTGDAVTPDPCTGWPEFWPWSWLELPPQPDYQHPRWLSAVWMRILVVVHVTHLRSWLAVLGMGISLQGASWPGVGLWLQRCLQGSWALQLACFHWSASPYNLTWTWWFPGWPPCWVRWASH